MKDISLFNNSFNVQKSSTYHLSIQLGLDGYAFSIADAIRKRFNAIKYSGFKDEFESTNGVYLDLVRKTIENDTFLSKNYKAVNFIYAYPSIIIIPKNSFERQDLKQTFELHYPLDDVDEIQFNHIQGWDFYIIFSVPSDLTNYLVNKFPQVEFYHQASVWLNSLYSINKKTSSYTALYFNTKSFYLVVVENEKLKYFNSYKFKDDTDIIYLISDTLKGLGQDNLKTDFLLGGDILENSARFNIFNNYFPHNSFLSIETNSSYIYTFEEVSEHVLHTLLTID